MPVRTELSIQAYNLTRGDLIDGKDEVLSTNTGRRNVTVTVRRPSGREVKRGIPMYNRVTITRVAPTLEERVADQRERFNTYVESKVNSRSRAVVNARQVVGALASDGARDANVFIGVSRLRALVIAEATWRVWRKALDKPIADGVEPVLAWDTFRQAFLKELASGAMSTDDGSGIEGENRVATMNASYLILGLAKPFSLIEEVVEAAQIEAHIDG